MISGCKLEKAIFTIRRTGRKKLIFKAMPKRERQRVTTRRPQRKQKKKNNNNNKTGAVYKPVITNVELQSTLSLRSMAVLSSRAQERRSREIRARSARERAEKLLPPQSLRGFSALARLYYLARPTKTAMLRRLKYPGLGFRLFR